MRLHGHKEEFTITDKISTVALLAKARKQGCRVTVKGGMAQLLEYNSNVDGWLAADDYWGVLSVDLPRGVGHAYVASVARDRSALAGLFCLDTKKFVSFFCVLTMTIFMRTSTALPLAIH